MAVSIFTNALAFAARLDDPSQHEVAIEHRTSGAGITEHRWHCTCCAGGDWKHRELQAKQGAAKHKTRTR